MILKYLVNARNLHLGNDLKDYIIEIAEIYITQDSLWRTENFYDKEGRVQIGEAILSSSSSNYAYGTRALDATYIAEKDGSSQVQVELMRIGNNMSNMFESILSYLWFVKDNSASHDFTYAYAVTEISPRPAIFLYNHKETSMHDGQHRDIAFSRSEIEYAFYIRQVAEDLITELKPKKARELNKEKELTIEDMDQGATFYTPNMNYQHYNRIERALFLLSNARAAQNILHKIATYISVLECLFSTERSEIGYKISQRIALYIGNDFEERDWIKRFIGDAYKIRSVYVHGAKVSDDEKKSKGGKNPIFSNENYINVSQQLDNLLRVILTKVILNDHKIFVVDDNLIKMFDKFIYEPNYIMGNHIGVTNKS